MIEEKEANVREAGEERERLLFAQRVEEFALREEEEKDRPLRPGKR